MQTSLDYQGPLDDVERIAAVLAKAGLTPEACRSKAALFIKAASALSSLDGWRAYFVPGRIEVLGKHTDYAGGHTIVAAAERGFCLMVTPRDDRQIRVIDAARGEETTFVFDRDLVPSAGHWSNYPMTVARRVARNFSGPLGGADIALASDLPPAAGMSSSSALLIAVFLALDGVNGLSERPEYQKNIHTPTDLADYLATIENGQSFGALAGDRGVGTFGGSEDHTAILTARPGHVCEYSYCPVTFRRAIALPQGYTFAIGSSGVLAEKTGTAMAKYNRASRLAGALVELWQSRTGRNDPHLAAALDSDPEAADRLKGFVEESHLEEATPSDLRSRLDHFLGENQEILPAAGDALQQGDVAEFGRLVNRSQEIAESLLGNQVPETVFLATAARQHGAAAASAFGAGFGGSVWALVKTDQAAALLDAWAAAYRDTFPEPAGRATFFLTGASPSAFSL